MTVTTDNAQNIVNETEILAWPRFSCFAHNLQLGAKKLWKFQSSYSCLLCSDLLSPLLHLQQKRIDLHVSQLNLIQDVTTRWSLTYYMVKQLLQQQ